MEHVTVAVIIPARFGSSRLPGKPLREILGRSMIQRVYERCTQADGLAMVCVATDDPRVVRAVEGFGGKVVLTRSDHLSGTDRLAEAVESMDVDIVVNVQGDQPFFDPMMIAEVVEPLRVDSDVKLSTLKYPISATDDLQNPAVVKVVTNRFGDALYFSRSLIPYPHRDVAHSVFEHVGIYAYRRETLLEISRLSPSTLEQVESLEQLRWLEHGLTIRVVQSQCKDLAFCGFSVDTPEDLARAEVMLREREAP
jgi:3-deoxy-manno-octulosonate cytidylyltransferase (CMP-KDO synthetase)